MTVRVLVCWDAEEEIDYALKVSRWIDDFLDTKEVRSGIFTVNQPLHSFGRELKDLPGGVRGPDEDLKTVPSKKGDER